MTEPIVRCAVVCLLVAAVSIGCGGGDEPKPSASAQAENKETVPVAVELTTTQRPADVPIALTRPLGAPPSVQQPLDDATITAKVRTALLADKAVKQTQLLVVTRAAVVTLRGTVGSQEYIDRAVAIARGADGVADVRSEVVVSLVVPSRPR